MSRRRRLLVAVAGGPVLVAAVLGVEVELAKRGPRLDDTGPLSYADDGAATAVWLGDSTAFGIGVTDGDDGVASRVARQRGERVVMLAVSGATVADVLRAQLAAVRRHEPDRIYVSVGANDVTHLTSKKRFRADYTELLEGLPADVPVVVLGIPDMGSPPRFAQPLRAIAGQRGRQLDDAVRTAAGTRRASGTTYVDIAGRTGPSFRRDPGRYFAADRFHPSAEGYRLWADAVLDASLVS